VKQQAATGIRVSVIMPAFNHARWVREALLSVLNQSRTDLELIVIDDASADATWAEIQSVREQFPDQAFYAIRHTLNQGAPATLNEGLQQAQGEYIAIINSDDVWDTSRLHRLLAVAESTGADFISTDVALLDAASQPAEVHEPHWLAWFEGLKQDYAHHADLLATLLRGNCLITTSNFFFHRRVYERVGEFADLRYVHDYDYALRVLEAGFQMQFLSGEKLLGYRLHGANTIREKPLSAIEENMRLLLGWLPCLHETFDEQRLQGLQIQLQDLYRYTREEWLTQVHRQVVVKEQELLPLIHDRNQWIAERDAWISERDEAIAALQQHLAEHQRWVADRDGWIAERDQMISGLQADMTLHRQWIADRDGWIAERDSLIRLLQQQQHELRNSHAYRLGDRLLSPLRRVRQFVGGVRYA
jgi:glycosyltransferase involved in cell wall biosynthesis